MCGVSGIVTTGAPPDLALLRQMTGRLGHRGPDGNGYYRDPHAALGHNRLAIIDAEGGAQPLSNEDGTLWLTFNGEIFNYLELADELRACGHAFRTASDSEVAVHAWEEWGAGCFERFNGQWALALWDRPRRRLVLARDRLGERPLFHTRVGDRFLFASEIKALFADPAVPRELDPAGLDQTLTYWSTVAPRTAFRGIEQLPPGHVGVLDRHGWRTSAYWRITFPERGQEPEQDLEVTAERIRASVVEACRVRFLRSDVPVGAYLSGGLDSAIAAAVVARWTDAPLHTFSLRFADRDYDEGCYQQQMSRLLGTRHEEVEVTRAQIAEVFPSVVRHVETPLLRAAPAPLFLLAGLVRASGYKVVVTGEGADEVLGGYDLFREARVRQFWSRDPDSARRGRAVELLYPWMTRSPGAAPAFARSFFGRQLDRADPALSHRPRWESTAALKGLLSAELRARVGTDPAGDVLATLPAEHVRWDPLAHAQWLEMTTLLPGYLLSSQGDRVMMAHSVEGRFPFLDPGVLALAAGLPAWHKLFGLDEKHVLKRAFADLVPEEVRRRPKQPYRAPDAVSFFGPDRPDWVDEMTSARAVTDAGVFDPARVTALTAKCTAAAGRELGNTDNMRALAVLSTQLLHATFVTGDDWPRAESLPPPEVAVDLCVDDRRPRGHTG